MPNPVMRFEITAADAKVLKAFYKKAFGWTFSAGPHKGVHALETGSKKGIAGSLLERGDHIPDYVSLYVEVEDIAKAVAKIDKSGGLVIRPPFKPDGKTELAIVADPEGHVLTLMQAKTKTKANAKGKRTKAKA